jgi:SAM-dependent methyltransferase
VASEPREELSLYVALNAWSVIVTFLHGFRGGVDQRGAYVGTTERFHIQQLPQNIEAVRLLDRHWLVYLRDDATGQRAAEACFFDRIARQYEVEVDPQRNYDNVRTLASLADVQPPDKVLDFGCGPGLSIGVLAGCDVVGCDVSSVMRELAGANGLHTVSPYDLPDLELAFDAMIASYVLHLAVPQIDLVNAMQCVRVGGKIAANFHKDRGLTMVVTAIAQTGLFSEISRVSTYRLLHGTMLVWERIQ